MNYPVTSEWITANAGSGKTTALTERVVRLLLLGVPPERIVCITYTKAAASEMRARVLEMLRQLLLMEESACRSRLQAWLGMAPSAAQLAHARGLFGRVLDSASGGVELTTIHGFCQNLLRRFPMEAGIAPHFTVLEDGAAEEALRRAKHALLTGLATADPWLMAAMELLGARGGEYRFETLAADSIAKRRLWGAIWRGQSPASLRGHLYALHGVEEDLGHAGLEAWLAEAVLAADLATIRQHLPTLLVHPTKTYRHFGEGLAAWLAQADTVPLPVRPLLDLLVKEDGSRYKRLLNDKEYPEHHPLRQVVEHLASLAERFCTRAAALAAAEESFAVAVFARALLDHYAYSKAAAHALDYDDLIDHTLRLVQHPETLGWVMSKLDHRIDHLLIDEAQDNSSAQWQLAHVLVEELIATSDGIGSGQLPRSLLVVGDEKQSIYSFQGAAPEQFQHYRAHFSEMFLGCPTPLVERTLNNSYRSAQAVLTLVDHVCARPEIARALASGQVPPHQLIRTEAAGRVVLYPPVLAPERVGAEPMVIPTEYTLETSSTQLLAEQIAATVAGWVHGEEAVDPGEVLILVHRRKPLVQPLIRALQRQGVPVAGIDRLMLADHLAVRDLLALMAWCMNEADDLALAQVLRSPLMGLSDAQLRAVAYGRPGSLWAQVKDPWLEELRGLRELSPYAFLTQLLEVADRRQAFARRFGEEVHEVLDELKAQAASMPAQIPPTLAAFYDWMSGNTRTIKREQDSGIAAQVRIMTVHGAKGLEAPRVILADTVNVPTTQQERLFTLTTAQGQPLPVLALSPLAKYAVRLEEAKAARTKALQDEYARLLYVALTRARDGLYVFGTASKKGEVKQGAWYAIIESSLRACGATQGEGGELVLEGEARTLPEGAPSKPSAIKVAKVPPPPLPAWARLAPTPPTALSASLAPSHLGGAQSAAFDRGANTRGVRIHRVLELLSAEATEAEIRSLVHYLAPDWDSAAQEKTVAEISVLVTQERWLWQYPRQAEVAIAGTVMVEGAAVPVSGQVDALIHTPEAVVIVDYKTGSHVSARAEEVPEPYLLQLNTYRALVAQLYPDRPIRCAILWTSSPRLMWLDDAVAGFMGRTVR